jgi:hypothetical protein
MLESLHQYMENKERNLIKTVVHQQKDKHASISRKQRRRSVKLVQKGGKERFLNE